MRAVTSGLVLLGILAGGARAEGGGFGGKEREERTLYVWAGDAARQAPDFLAVIDFDEDSPGYGQVVRTLPIPPPGNVGNEPHHCGLSADRQVLACGGLLSLLRGQAGIYMNAFDTAVTVNQRAQDDATVLSAKLTDADVIDANSQLALAQRALEASLTATATGFRLTLLNYLK